jgi:acetyl-CoA carboxylase carboxyltransferase component
MIKKINITNFQSHKNSTLEFNNGVNVIVGKAFGSSYVAMNAKAIGADLTIAWEDSQIGMMDAKIAAQIMCEGEGSDKIDAYVKDYQELQTSSISAARRGYVDQIIATEDTRKYVVGAFEMLFTKREERPAKKHGTI